MKAPGISRLPVIGGRTSKAEESFNSLFGQGIQSSLGFFSEEAFAICGKDWLAAKIDGVPEVARTSPKFANRFLY
jgi:hypothetical protein